MSLYEKSPTIFGNSHVVCQSYMSYSQYYGWSGHITDRHRILYKDYTMATAAHMELDTRSQKVGMRPSSDPKTKGKPSTNHPKNLHANFLGVYCKWLRPLPDGSPASVALRARCSGGHPPLQTCLNSPKDTEQERGPSKDSSAVVSKGLVGP